MAAVRTIPLERLPAEIRRVVDVLVPQMGVALKNGVARELFLEIIELSPVGHPGVDRHPGKFRASNIISLGSPIYKVLGDQTTYGIPGDPEIQAVLNMSTVETLDSPIWIANAAADENHPDDPYSWVLELGRHVDSLGRMAGSIQAMYGVYVVAVAHVGERSATLENNALRAVEALF